MFAALRAGRSPREIMDFFGFPKATVYRLKKVFDKADDKGEVTGERKNHSRRSDSCRHEEFLSTLETSIKEDPGKSMGALAKEMGVARSTIHKAVHEDLQYHSYKLRRRHLLTQRTKETRLAKARSLLNELKHGDSVGMLRFFSDEKNFVQDMKVNVQNNRWLCADPSDVPVVMHSKVPASVMVLGVVSSEGHVMPPHIFPQGLRLNADGYIAVLRTVVVPWMDSVSVGRPYVFQQDSAPAHKAKKTQSWLLDNVPHHWSPDLWPPSSPDCNPLDYFVWGAVEGDVNKAPHSTVGSLKTSIIHAMAQLDKDCLVRACASFRARLQRVIDAEGDHIE